MRTRQIILPSIAAAILSGGSATAQDANAVSRERTPLDQCIVNQAARIERLEPSVLEAANLVVSVGCKTEMKAYFVEQNLPANAVEAMSAMSEDDGSETNFTGFQGTIIKTQELTLQAAQAVLNARERRLASPNP